MPAAAYALAAWTALTWGTRVRNALQDDEPVDAYVVPAVLLVLAAITVLRPRRWAPLLAIASSVAWLVRVPMLLANGHGAAFVAVHGVLAVVTWVLAAIVVRSTARTLAPTTAS